MPDAPMMRVSTTPASTPNVTLASLECGHGSPLVLVHGGNSRASHFSKIMRVLGESWKTLAYDQRGFGDTAIGKDTPISHPHWMEDLEAFRSAKGLGAIDLVGWSLGASVSLNYAAHYPSNVKSLTLLGAPNLGAPIHRPLFDERLKHYALGGSQKALVDKTFEKTLAMLSDSARNSKSDVVEQLYAEQVANRPDSAERIISSYLNRPDFAPILAAIRCNVHIIAGDEDPICGLQMAKKLKEDLSQASTTMIAQCGHYYALERPSAVAREIAAGLERMHQEPS